MSYIIKTYDGDKVLYFYKMCRRVYTPDEIPAFREDPNDALIFYSMEKAEQVKNIIHESFPDIKLKIEPLSLRDPDGFVPLEKTMVAMLSDDPAERIWAEYEQLNTRRHKLKEYRKSLKGMRTNLTKLEMIDEQIAHMHDYMIDLLARCEFEGIDLKEVEKGIASA